jgi:putative RecB family exonuclease
MAAVAQRPQPSTLSYRFFERIASEQLVEIRERLEGVLEDRANQLTLFPAESQAIVPMRQPVEKTPSPCADPAHVLSPSSVRAFLACSAKWWFKYGLSLPEPKNSAVALGCAVHRALEINFREKIDTKEDLDCLGAVAVFRVAWDEQVQQTEFRDDEDPGEIGRTGERLVIKYMEEAAPQIDPAAVELDVAGEIGGVSVRGKVDLLDVEGRIIDVKTAARKPTGIAPDYAFQLATYRQITPGASGEARLDTLVKTKAVQFVPQSYSVGEQDLRATEILYPLVQEGMRKGLYFPNRQSVMCSRRNCAFWRHCEREYGGTIAES